MPNVPALEAKVDELVAAATANGERFATEKAALQAELTAAIADPVPADAISKIQTVIDALNVGAPAPAPAPAP